MLDYSAAEITELTVFVDSTPKMRKGEHILWATVLIHFTMDGLYPDINIHVPLKSAPGSSYAVRKAEALRYAKVLLGRAYASDLENEPNEKLDQPKVQRARIVKDRIPEN